MSFQGYQGMQPESNGPAGQAPAQGENMQVPSLEGNPGNFNAGQASGEAGAPGVPSAGGDGKTTLW
jgi:hypothetical protein